MPEKMAMGGSIDDQMKDTMSKRESIEKEIRELMNKEPKDFDKIEALKQEYESLGKAYKKLNKQKLDEMRGGLKFK
jgi:predicted  nucleic acid-binding Zn-ribbon protein